MKAAFVQLDCQFAKKDHNINNAIQYMQRQIADLYVLPELFNTGYLFTSEDELIATAEPVPDGITTRLLEQYAARNDCFIIAGLAERGHRTFYNSAVLIGPNGYLSTYRKIHLFDKEKKWFIPGDKHFEVYDIGIAKIGIMICFDWIFPESARSLAILGADIICHPANLVLPYCQNAMVTRCLENGLFGITANRIGRESCKDKTIEFTGMSQITSNHGEILARASKNKEEVFVVEFDPLLARSKHITPRNHLLTDRRPSLYILDNH
jgi:predicted amidohydrolase